MDGAEYQKRPRRVQQTQEKQRQEALNFDPALISYRYPYAVQTQTPSKLTATQLKGRLIDQRVAEDTEQRAPRPGDFRAPRFLAAEHRLSPAERGTAMHLAMQFLDFSRTASRREIDAEIMRMAQRHFLTEEQAEAVDRDKIARLFAAPLGQALRTVPPEKLWREYRFSVLEKLSDYLPAETMRSFCRARWIAFMRAAGN